MNQQRREAGDVTTGMGSVWQSGGSQRPLRVLMGVPAPGATAGGTALLLPMLVEDLRQSRDLELFHMPYGRWEEGEPLPLKIWHQIVDVARYPGRLRAADPDLVHLNTCLDRRALLRDTTFVALSRLLGRRVFLEWHGSETALLHSGALPWRALGRLLLRSVQALGTLSTPEADEVQHLRHAPPCFVVKNPIDPARYGERFDLHGQLGIERPAPLVLFISRLIPGKGLEEVIGAFPRLVERHGAHLLVVGDGPVRAAATALARSLHLESSVHFHGAVPEVETLRFYNGADVLAFPSRLTEGLPMVLLQAIAAGLGLVTTRLRAAVEYLREPEHCLFVDPQDSTAIGAALDRLLSDREELARMQAANRALARRFDRKTVAAEFGRVYREIVDGESASAGDRASSSPGKLRRLVTGPERENDA